MPDTALPAAPDELHALERFVIDNDDLLALEERIGRFNIFDALGIARAEIRHSNYLAWLLTPGESHGLGGLFLKAVAMDFLRQARQEGLRLPISPAALDGVELQGVEVRREWRNIDLLITCAQPRLVFVIENKVDSSEHSNQLQRYAQLVTANFKTDDDCLFIYLTPDGAPASEPDRWVPYSYANLHHVLLRTRRANSGAIGGDVAVFLDHYLALIGDRFMENDEIAQLCRRIYTNHRRALDLIWDRVGATPFIGALQRWAEERPHQWVLLGSKRSQLELIPTAWRAALPPIGKNGGCDWIVVQLHADTDKLELIVEVGETTQPMVREQVVQLLLEGGFGFSVKRKPTRCYTRMLRDTLCDLPQNDSDEASAVQCVEERLARLLEQTEGLPAKLLTLRNQRPT